MGQRYLELATSYTAYAANNTATIHVSQIPPNPALLAPGPALFFVVVDGVPSLGLFVMIGSGQIGTQTLLDATQLPPSNLVTVDNAKESQSNNANKTSGASTRSRGSIGVLLSVAAFVFGYVLF